MYELAKKAREDRKAKARRLAAPGTLDEDQATTSATWSPAEPLNADVKTGARPVGKGARLYNKGGKVSADKPMMRADRKRRATGGRALEKEIGNAMVNKDVRAANEEREGIKHVGGFKKGGKIARKTGGSVPSDKETGLTKARVGEVQVKPVRGKAENYKKGGRIRKADGGILDTIANALAGRGYIDGSTWMKNEPIVDTDMKFSAKPMRREKASAPHRRKNADKMTPAQYSREMAMAYENEQPVMRGASAAPVQSESFMKKGGKVKRAMGGRDPSYVGASSVTMDKKPVMRPKDIEDRRPREPETRDLLDSDQINRLERGYKKGGKVKKADGGYLPSPEDAIGSEERLKGLKVMPGKSSTAAARVTPAQLRREEGYAAADMKAPRAGRKSGGRTKGKPSIVVKIETGKQAPMMGMPGGIPPVPPVPPMPPVPPAAAAPMGPGAIPPAMGMGMGMGDMPIGRKAGGRITKVASSYKDMEAGAVSGEGRLQKTDIAKHHRDAPARKAGGRISKVAKSYKDMTAGAGDGEGRLQKTDIAKAKKARGK